MFKANIGVGAIYTFRVLKDGVVVQETNPTKNLFLDTGVLNCTTSGTSIMNTLFVGTGNSTPEATQSSLDSAIASRTYDQRISSRDARTTNTSDPDNYYGSLSCTWRFPLGAVVGNVTEAGWGRGTVASHTLASRVLVRDSSGNPTAITVLADEQLEVTVEFRCYCIRSAGTFELKDKNGAVISTHTFTSVPRLSTFDNPVFNSIKFDVNANNSLWSVNPIPPTGLPSATGAFTCGTTYIGGGKVRGRVYIGYDTGNGVNIRTFNVPVVGIVGGGQHDLRYLFQIDPPVVKNNLQTFTLQFEVGISSI